MDNLLTQLQMMVDYDDMDFNQTCHEFASNPYRPLLSSILIERKDVLRGKLNIGAHFDNDESSPEINTILSQLSNPTFPLLDAQCEKDEEWVNLEKKYYDEIGNIKNELQMKEIQICEDRKRALDRIHAVLSAQMKFRPIDERDFNHAKESVSKRFDNALTVMRDDCATKILVLRRDIELQGRKRKNFDKQTTDILQQWFNDHRSRPYPTEEEKNELANRCGIKISQVNNWFGNQRIRSKQQANRVREEAESNSCDQQQGALNTNIEFIGDMGYLPHQGTSMQQQRGIPDHNNQATLPHQHFYDSYFAPRVEGNQEVFHLQNDQMNFLG